MSIESCLNAMISKKLITKAQYNRLAQEATVNKNKLISTGEELDPESAANKGAELAIKQMNDRLTQQRAALQFQSDRYTANVNELTNSKDPIKTSRTQLQNLEYNQQGILGHMTANLSDFVEKMRSKVPGGFDLYWKNNQHLMVDVIRSLNGETNVSKDAAEFAKSIKAGREYAVGRLANAGIKHETSTGFDLTHNWDAHRLIIAGKEKFMNDFLPAVDKENMFNPDGTLMNDTQLKTSLSGFFDQLTGQEKDYIGGKLGQGNSSAVSSKIHIKGSDNYLKLFNQYGSGDLYSSILNDFHDLSTQTALAESYGPQYKSTWNKLKDIQDTYYNGLSDSKKTSQQFRSANNILLDNNKIFKVISGDLDGTPSHLFGSVIGGLKNLGAMANLGFSVVSSLSDYAHIKSTSELLGMNATKVFGGILKDIGGKGSQTNRLATRLGQQISWAHGLSMAATRQSDFSMTSAFSRATARGADIVVKSTYLHQLQHENEKNFALALQGLLSDKSQLSFGQLPSKLQASLKYANIDESLWDKIRHSDNLTEIDGVHWLDPLKMKDAASDAYLGMVSRYTRMAVPVPGAEARAVITGASRMGTVDREVRGLLTMFQGFTISSTLRDLQTLLFHPALNGTLGRLGWASRILLYGTITGALGMQLRSMAQGKDTEDMSNPEFWVKSGLYGSTFGLGFISSIDPKSLAGTTSDDVNKMFVPIAMEPLIRLFVGGKQALGNSLLAGKAYAKGDKQEATDKLETAGKSIAKTLTNSKFMSTWMTDLLIQRLVTDKLNEQIDPNYGSSFNRVLTSLKNRTGQGFWWKPGTTAPQRAPGVGEHVDFGGNK